MSAALTFRPFSSSEDYDACTRLQEEVWGEGFSERVSAAILRIANRMGGLAAGAFHEDGTLQGFVFGLTGIMEGETVHWSDMLAVRGEFRDRGLGTLLKLYQREVLLERGIRRMHWTFDPLQGRNAHVNLSKLGIVSREYVTDMYGDTDSPLHRGVGTDRLVATWDMDSERVLVRLEGVGGERPGLALEGVPRVLPYRQVREFPVPGPAALGVSGSRILLTVPGTIDRMMEADLPLAVQWRHSTREAFLHYISRGYEVRGFVREGIVSSYMLTLPQAEEGENSGDDGP